MKDLDKTWKLLIVLGVVFLIGYIGFSIFESISGSRSEFNQKINPLENNILITPGLEKHLQEASSQS